MIRIARKASPEEAATPSGGGVVPPGVGLLDGEVVGVAVGVIVGVGVGVAAEASP